MINTVSSNNSCGLSQSGSNASLRDLMCCILICSSAFRVGEQLHCESQDELVLLEHIERQYDAKLLENGKKEIVISIDGRLSKYEKIRTMKFTSQRKMMSVAVRRMEDQALLIYSKGADGPIKERLINRTS